MKNVGSSAETDRAEGGRSARVFAVLFFAAVVVSCTSRTYVELTVTGTAASVKVEYVDDHNVSRVDSGVSVPWTYSRAADDRETVWLMATNETTTGEVSAAIISDGQTKATKTTSRPLGSVYVSWSVPSYVYPLFAFQRRGDPSSQRR